MRTKLQEGESLIYIAKKHWIVYLIGLFLAIAIVLAASFIKQTFLGIVLGIVVMLYIHLERKFNIWVVTNRRFIDEKGIVIFYSKETPIDKINNITCSKDILGRMLGYGGVFIQSAAELGLTKANLISKPEMLQAAIIEAQNQFVTQNIIPSDTAPCPICKELIKKDALKCRFCGTVLVEMTTEKVLQQTVDTTFDQNTTDEQKESYEGADAKGNNTNNTNQEIFERRGKIWRP
ncbi:PH domain-containing protein [Thermodesulfovibrio sp. 1176]|uniref:PH domain-containing protein n=1 Tax=Thermodesulfovibrio sp. 1176 TaxID=3043424 RepID=UPI0024826321|nr:PH domain-containing protein [Thermodesulfovibrio sp. 1176]MDI1472969.1 PH domain-containing protein [Thermodesulfovibrio sp. 1176]